MLLCNNLKVQRRNINSKSRIQSSLRSEPHSFLHLLLLFNSNSKELIGPW